MPAREQGTVKSWDNRKRYGFITRDSGGDVFVHYTAIQASGLRALQVNQRVDFVVVQAEKGPQAQDVKAV